MHYIGDAQSQNDVKTLKEEILTLDGSGVVASKPRAVEIALDVRDTDAGQRYAARLFQAPELSPHERVVGVRTTLLTLSCHVG